MDTPEIALGQAEHRQHQAAILERSAGLRPALVETPPPPPLRALCASVVNIPLHSLTIHPAHAHLPGWAEDDPEFDAFTRDIQQRGIQDPLKVIPLNSPPSTLNSAAYSIVDGCQRFRAATRLPLLEVPIQIVPEDQVQAIILQILLQRRHYTKGARAYTAALFLRGNSQLSTLNSQPKRSVESLAEQHGLGFTTLKSAFQVLDIFNSSPAGESYRAVQEPLLLTGDTNLGYILAGWAGRQATKGLAKATVAALDMWSRSWADLSKRAAHWDKFDDTAKAEAASKITTFVEALPPDLLTHLHKKLTAEKNKRSKDPHE